MELILTVLRCPDNVVPEQRRVPGGDFVIGRGADASWVLPDPDRLLSKHHCVLEFRGGGWQVRDLSTNGTFVNHADAPVGRDHAISTQPGLRLPSAKAASIPAKSVTSRAMLPSSRAFASWSPALARSTCPQAT